LKSGSLNLLEPSGPVQACNWISLPLLGVTKLDKEKNQCIRGKTGAQNVVKEIKQYQEIWLQHIRRMDTNRLNKHYNVNQKTKKHRTTEKEMEGPISF